MDPWLNPYINVLISSINSLMTTADIFHVTTSAMANKVVNRLLGDRLRTARKEAGLTQVQLAEKLRLGQSAVAEIEGGRVERPKQMREIARALKVSEEWLLGESEDRIVRVPIGEEDDDHARAGDAGPEATVSSVGPYRGTLPGAIPDLEVGGGAGPGENALIYQTVAGDGLTYSADAVRGEIVLPPYLLGEYTRSAAGKVHAVRVRGDSMETTLTSGDRVFADTNDIAIGQGGVFVIVDHRYDEVLVKRLRRVGRGASMQIEIVSDNEKQGNDTVEPNEITVVGRAVARLTRL